MEFQTLNLSHDDDPASKTKQIISKSMHVYYINLERSVERDKRIRETFKSYGLVNFHRIQGIEGKHIDRSTLSTRENKLSDSELGCVKSHIEAVSQAYNDGHQMVLIMEDDCNFEYLQYHEYTLEEIINLTDKKYDVYQLGITTTPEAAEHMVRCENLVSSFYCDSAVCYLITRNGMKKILQSNSMLKVADNYMYENTDTCVVNRPYFTYYYSSNVHSTIHTGTDRETQNNLYADLSKRYFDNYYRSISAWDKIYCVNLGIDVIKYYDMLRCCRFFNKKPENFFYPGLLGKNYPQDPMFESVIESGLVDRSILNVPEVSKRYGMIGLNVTNREIFKDAEANGYRKILMLEDDIVIHDRWIDHILKFIKHIEKSDVMYLGSSMYMSREQIDEAFDLVDRSTNRCQTQDKEEVKTVETHINMFKVKEKVFDKRYGLAGGFAISFSLKAVKILLNRMDVIDNVSDRLYSSIIFNQISNFKTGLGLQIPDTPNNLESYVIVPNLVDVMMKKISLTDSISIPPYFEKDSQIVIDRMIKINRINYKIKHSLILNISILSKSMTIYQSIQYIMMKNKINFNEHNEQYPRLDIIFCDSTKNLLHGLTNTRSSESPLIILINSMISKSVRDTSTTTYDLQISGPTFEDMGQEFKRIVIDRRRNILCAYDHENTQSVKKIQTLFKDRRYDDVIRFTDSDLSNDFLYQYYQRGRFDPDNPHDKMMSMFKRFIKKGDVDGSFMIRKISDVIDMNDTVHLVDMCKPTIISVDYGFVNSDHILTEHSDDPFCAKNRIYNYQRDLRRITEKNTLPLFRDPIDLQIVRRIMEPIEKRLGIDKNNIILRIIRWILRFIARKIIIPIYSIFFLPISSD